MQNLSSIRTLRYEIRTPARDASEHETNKTQVKLSRRAGYVSINKTFPSPARSYFVVINRQGGITVRETRENNRTAEGFLIKWKEVTVCVRFGEVEFGHSVRSIVSNCWNFESLPPVVPLFADVTLYHKLFGIVRTATQTICNR